MRHMILIRKETIEKVGVLLWEMCFRQKVKLSVQKGQVEVQGDEAQMPGRWMGGWALTSGVPGQLHLFLAV